MNHRLSRAITILLALVALSSPVAGHAPSPAQVGPADASFGTSDEPGEATPLTTTGVFLESTEATDRRASSEGQTVVRNGGSATLTPRAGSERRILITGTGVLDPEDDEDESEGRDRGRGNDGDGDENEDGDDRDRGRGNDGNGDGDDGDRGGGNDEDADDGNRGRGNDGNGTEDDESPSPDAGPAQEPTETPTPEPAPSLTDTATTIPTATPTSTPTDTPTSSPTDTATDTPTDSPTDTATDTPTSTPTDTSTDTPTDTPVETPSETPTDTPTATPTVEATDTPIETTTSPPSGGGDSDDGSSGRERGDDTDGNVEIADWQLLNQTVTVGETVVVRADLTNFHPARGQTTLNLTTDGSLIAQETVTLGVDERRTVYLRTVPNAPGEYDLRLDGTSVGNVTVTATNRSPTTTAASSTGVPSGTITPTQGSTATPTAREPPEGSESQVAAPTETPLPGVGGPSETETIVAGGLSLLLLYGVGVAVYVMREQPPNSPR